MEINEAVIGTRVKTNRTFCGIPAGTEGVIDQDYGTGIMVAWNLPAFPLPRGYTEYDGVPMIISKILRDGFDKETELKYLEVVK